MVAELRALSLWSEGQVSVKISVTPYAINHSRRHPVYPIARRTTSGWYSVARSNPAAAGVPLYRAASKLAIASDSSACSSQPCGHSRSSSRSSARASSG